MDSIPEADERSSYAAIVINLSIPHHGEHKNSKDNAAQTSLLQEGGRVLIMHCEYVSREMLTEGLNLRISFLCASVMTNPVHHKAEGLLF